MHGPHHKVYKKMLNKLSIRWLASGGLKIGGCVPPEYIYYK
jgi:hypothetical protein